MGFAFRTIVALGLMGLSAFSVADGGDVPVDSARGNYEGADNIHWYMQDTLDFNKWDEEPSEAQRVVRIEECNTEDPSRSCNGLLFQAVDIYAENDLEGVPSFESHKQAIVNLHILVDDTIDYAWRYALKQVRDTNRAFKNSLVPITLMVSAIESVDMESRFGSNIDDVFDAAWDAREELTATNEADIVAVFMATDRAVEDDEGFVTDGLGSVPIYYGINVAVTVSDDSNVFAHEIGHNFGLVHDIATLEDNDEDATSAFVEGGLGYVDPETECGTLMSYANCVVPLFSSPLIKVRPNGSEENVPLGSDTENAQEALKASRWMVALSNEVVHQPDDSSARAGSPSAVRRSAGPITGFEARVPDIRDRALSLGDLPPNVQRLRRAAGHLAPK